MIKLQALGQVGYRMKFDQTVVYIDPYLSHSVQEKENPAIVRMRPISIDPGKITDAAYVLITHEHRDHCDEDTLIPLSQASKDCLFVAPVKVGQYLEKIGINTNRILTIKENPISIDNDIKLFPIPSAHPVPRKNISGGWDSIGYVIEFEKYRLYHAGDTSVCDELIEALKKFDKIHAGFIPVNERNFYRDRAGIIGNMSVRDAFSLVQEIKMDTLVPTHWDMFEINQVYKEEIELLYKKIKPDFNLVFEPSEL